MNGNAKQEINNRIRFVSNIGGFDIESIDAEPVNPSPQQREIAPGATLLVPLYVVPIGYCFRLRRYVWKAFSAQGYQDCSIWLQLGRKYLETGKQEAPETTPPFTVVNQVVESRITAISGGELSSISSASGSGIPDNFPRKWDENFGLAFERDGVYAEIKNVSAVYTHVFQVSIDGYVIANKNRRKENMLFENAFESSVKT